MAPRQTSTTAICKVAVGVHLSSFNVLTLKPETFCRYRSEDRLQMVAKVLGSQDLSLTGYDRMIVLSKLSFVRTKFSQRMEYGQASFEVEWMPKH